VSEVEVADATWRLESLVGPRNLYQYVIADGGEALIVDAGATATPREVIMPALRRIGVAADQVTMVVVTHPDLDHQGGLAGLREVLPNAIAACGFADRMMVSEPERLITDRYGAFELEHEVGYTPADKAWMRANYGAPAAVEVGTIGRRRHLREDEIVAAEGDVVRRVARMHRKLRRCALDQLEDHVGVEAHALAPLGKVSAVLLHDLARAFVQHLDADFLQHPERGQVDRFQLVVGDQLGRREGNAQRLERRLLEKTGAAGAFSRAAAAACALGCDRRLRGLHCCVHEKDSLAVADAGAIWTAGAGLEYGRHDH
jgi:hypothetical protein